VNPVRVLITDSSGQPKEWQSFKTAACYYARDKVLWSIGDTIKTFYGGLNHAGDRSQIDIPPILGVTGPLFGDKFTCRTSMFVDREVLYVRDRYICAYCGNQYKNGNITIDHIMPRSRGGKHVWMNAVSACKSCNHRKAARTPEEANMPLLYVPYVPNAQEKFIMQNRNILSDQMDFLSNRIPKHSRLFVDGKIVLE
jgi:hypothetical protein